eukprot:1196104-Pleurochrysis_carterae.AAC.1
MGQSSGARSLKPCLSRCQAGGGTRPRQAASISVEDVETASSCPTTSRSWLHDFRGKRREGKEEDSC